jgi:hypothetical protein
MVALLSSINRELISAKINNTRLKDKVMDNEMDQEDISEREVMLKSLIKAKQICQAIEPQTNDPHHIKARRVQDHLAISVVEDVILKLKCKAH